MSNYQVTMTPADNFAGRSKVRFGVGEQIALAATMTSAGSPPVAGTWRVRSGPAAVTATNGNPRGRATIKCGDVGGQVVLELIGTGRQVLHTQPLQVVAPTGVNFTARDLSVPDGVGFVAAMDLLPKDVSFKAVEIRESSGPWIGNGHFKKHAPTIGELAGAFNLIHPVLGEWLPCLGGAQHNKVSATDTVSMSNVDAQSGDTGDFTWTIPWLYRVKNTNNEHRLVTAIHKIQLDASGKIIISKFNITRSKQLLSALGPPPGISLPPTPAQPRDRPQPPPRRPQRTPPMPPQRRTPSTPGTTSPPRRERGPAPQPPPWPDNAPTPPAAPQRRRQGPPPTPPPWPDPDDQAGR